MPCAVTTVTVACFGPSGGSRTRAADVGDRCVTLAKARLYGIDPTKVCVLVEGVFVQTVAQDTEYSANVYQTKGNPITCYRSHLCTVVHQSIAVGLKVRH